MQKSLLFNKSSKKTLSLQRKRPMKQLKLKNNNNLFTWKNHNCLRDKIAKICQLKKKLNSKTTTWLKTVLTLKRNSFSLHMMILKHTEQYLNSSTETTAVTLTFRTQLLYPASQGAIQKKVSNFNIFNLDVTCKQ